MSADADRLPTDPAQIPVVGRGGKRLALASALAVLRGDGLGVRTLIDEAGLLELRMALAVAVGAWAAELTADGDTDAAVTFVAQQLNELAMED